jgi:hypothetical protein
MTNGKRAPSPPDRAREGPLAVENSIRKSTRVHSKISIVHIPQPMHLLLRMLTLYHCVSLLVQSHRRDGRSPPHAATSSATSTLVRRPG